MHCFWLYMCVCVCVCVYACQVTSVMSDSLWPYGPWSARLLCSWDSLGKNTGVDCHFLLWESSWPRDLTHVSCIGRRILYHWATLWLLRSVILLFAEPPKLTNKTGTLLLNQQLHQRGALRLLARMFCWSAYTDFYTVNNLGAISTFSFPSPVLLLTK